MNNWSTDNFELKVDDPLERLTNMTPYQRSEDKRGHDVLLAARFPKEVARSVQELKELGPYKTASDVVRDAVWLGLQVINLRVRSDSSWQMVMQLIKLANETIWEASVYDQEEGFVLALDKLCRNNDESKAAEMLQERAALIPPKDRRRRILEEKLAKYRLDYLLKQTTS